MFKNIRKQISASKTSKINFEYLAVAMVKIKKPRILYVGAGDGGREFQKLASIEDIELIRTDIEARGEIEIICDGHFLPFSNQCFDLVVTQAVLEHVFDPFRVASEIERVTKHGGLIYSEIPFMQQVHEGAYDFCRFTVLGHLSLYSRSDYLFFGPNRGPVISFIWACRYLALAVTKSHILSSGLYWLLYLLVGWTDNYIKPIDAWDGCSGSYAILQRNCYKKSTSLCEIVPLYKLTQKVIPK